jgi:hypothetical protein
MVQLRAVFHGGSRGSGEVSLGPILNYHSTSLPSVGGQPPAGVMATQGSAAHRVNVLSYSKDRPGPPMKYGHGATAP